VTAESLKPILEGQIAASARLMTDSAGLYKKIGKSFASHEVVDHAAKEYVRGDVTTNTVEGIGRAFRRLGREPSRRFSPHAPLKNAAREMHAIRQQANLWAGYDITAEIDPDYFTLCIKCV
jgi:ISXO2-like transposase domain